MPSSRAMIAFAIAVFSALVTAGAVADEPGDETEKEPFGFYAGPAYQYHGTYKYYFRPYYYRQSHFHYAIAHLDRPRYVYFYNPYRHHYWGRYDFEGDEGRVFSMLPEEHRKGGLALIPDEAFGEPGPLPMIPGSDAVLKPPPMPPTEPPQKPPSAEYRQDGWRQREGGENAYYLPLQAGTQTHQAVFFTDRPRYVYYLDPEKQQYWGRLDLTGKAWSRFWLIAEKHRVNDVTDIPEDAYGTASAMRPVPGTTYQLRLPPPPPDASPAEAGEEQGADSGSP